MHRRSGQQPLHQPAGGSTHLALDATEEAAQASWQAMAHTRWGKALLQAADDAQRTSTCLHMQPPQTFVVIAPHTWQGPQKRLPALPGIVSGFLPDAMRPSMTPARWHTSRCAGQSPDWHFGPQ